MDLFFQACPLKKKRRIHFHEFMLEVHQFIYEWRQTYSSDPLIAYTKQLRDQIRVLCFDEFQVTDIADAMILSRLFEQLFNSGLIIIATSNQHPDQLYLHGLQRQLFLPFIQKLKQNAEIIELVSKADYRLVHLIALKQTIYIGHGVQAQQFLQHSLINLIHQGKTQAIQLKVQGRLLNFKAAHGDILYSSFGELCHRPLAAADYLAIAKKFHTVFIADIPQLSIEMRDQAKRLMILIDALYEIKTKLIANIAVPISQIYCVDNQLDYRRTQSRLIEMQSEFYLKIPHQPCLPIAA
jgi:cell division protein ZapE